MWALPDRTSACSSSPRAKVSIAWTRWRKAPTASANELAAGLLRSRTRHGFLPASFCQVIRGREIVPSFGRVSVNWLRYGCAIAAVAAAAAFGGPTAALTEDYPTPPLPPVGGTAPPRPQARAPRRPPP